VGWITRSAVLLPCADPAVRHRATHWRLPEVTGRETDTGRGIPGGWGNPIGRAPVVRPRLPPPPLVSLPILCVSREERSMVSKKVGLLAAALGAAGSLALVTPGGRRRRGPRTPRHHGAARLHRTFHRGRRSAVLAGSGLLSSPQAATRPELTGRVLGTTFAAMAGFQALGMLAAGALVGVGRARSAAGLAGRAARDGGDPRAAAAPWEGPSRTGSRRGRRSRSR
jgi:hypothetical protein